MLPLESDAEQMTFVRPSLKQLPERGVQANGCRHDPAEGPRLLPKIRGCRVLAELRPGASLARKGTK